MKANRAIQITNDCFQVDCIDGKNSHLVSAIITEALSEVMRMHPFLTYQQCKFKLKKIIVSRQYDIR
jgi:hypothetical protein